MCLPRPLRRCRAPLRSTNNILAAGLKYKLINSIGATQLVAQSAQDDNDGNEDDDLWWFRWFRRPGPLA